MAKATRSTRPTKRKRDLPQTPSKRRKLNFEQPANFAAHSIKGKGKQRAFERPTIPIPEVLSDHDQDISDQDLQFVEENAPAISFLDVLDREAIARSKLETKRLHKLSKPPRLERVMDDLPSIDSHDEDKSDRSDAQFNFESNEEEEQHYEREPRGRRGSWDNDKNGTISRLPIKLAGGKIVDTGGYIPRRNNGSEPEDEIEPLPPAQDQGQGSQDVATGARFGRPAVAEVVSIQSRKMRIRMAKEQIAGLCQDILADPENNLGLLRRLQSFSLPTISSPDTSVPLRIDPLIRRLAMMSQLVVFKDIIPGYRIRALTVAEKAEKVSQMVRKTREWEQGLVGIYQTYLRILESELKGKTEFSELALSGMCTLLSKVTHFNFRTNLMAAVVAQLSRKSWDQSSDLCLKTIISVFREDMTGVSSLEIVRLLNRMVKEREFKIHPNSLSCLLHLRLRSELGGVRASETKVSREGPTPAAKPESRGKTGRKRAKGKKVEGPYLSKKATKALKEKKEIEQQFRQAEGEIDREDRASMHSETLKLVFVLYFRILKAPHWTPLLRPALQGICRFAHLVNVDFFKDLLKVLKGLVAYSITTESTNGEQHHFSGHQAIQHQLLCIATAFELLSGQGEALNIDLGDFVNHLYALIPHIALLPEIESLPAGLDDSRGEKTTTDLLLRTLSFVFPAHEAGAASPRRAAAFAKRLLVACLSFPPTTILRSLQFVQGLLVQEPKLRALLSTEDRTVDGIYRPELDDPQLANPFGTWFWELSHLAMTHWDTEVKQVAYKLSKFEEI